MFLNIFENCESLSTDIFEQKYKLGTKCVELLNSFKEIDNIINTTLTKIENTSHKEDVMSILANYTLKNNLLNMNKMTAAEFFVQTLFFGVNTLFEKIKNDYDNTIEMAKIFKSHIKANSDIHKDAYSIIMSEANKFDDKYYIDKAKAYIEEVQEEFKSFYSYIKENNLIKYKYFNTFNIPKKTIRYYYYYNKNKIGYVTEKNIEDRNNISAMETYEFRDFLEVIEIYKALIIENKLVIKICKNCGKFFIPDSRVDEIYCSNPSPQLSSKTCKEYGAKKTYREAIKNNKIKAEHERTSQYFRMKIRRTKEEKDKILYEERFEKYKNNYEKNKIKYKNKKITEDNFVKWIIEQKS